MRIGLRLIGDRKRCFSAGNRCYQLTDGIKFIFSVYGCRSLINPVHNIFLCQSTAVPVMSGTCSPLEIYTGSNNVT